jgi:peptidoglycan/LPS O-acetylase OafA/YrhL
MSRRLEYLDSSRGIAAVIVLLSHFIGAFSLPDEVSFLQNTGFHFFWDGKAAVSYFFVLSGFVLSNAFFKNDIHFKSLNYFEFILRRFLRIYPVFIFVLLLSWLASRFIFKWYELNNLPEATEWIKLFWRTKGSFLSLVKESFLIVRIPQEPENRLINQDWTLTIELIISLLVPVFILIAKRNIFWLLITGLILLRIHADNWIIEFLFGILIASNIEKIREILIKQNKFIKLALLIFITLLYSSQFIITLPSILNDYFLKITMASLLIFILTFSSIQFFLNNKILVFLGDISYSLYLCHFILIMIISPKIFYLLRYMEIQGEFLTRIIVILTTITLTIILSYLIHVLIEKPFLLLNKKISKLVK